MSQPRRRLRVMTYNIRLGIETSLADIAAAVDEAGVPDVLALQEIGVEWQMGERVDEPAVLAAALGLPHHCFSGSLTDAAGGRFGVALLSRFPFRSVDVSLLPRERDEQRTALRAVLDTRPAVTVLNTHLAIFEPERILQGERLGWLLSGCRGPVVLLGDLNDVPGSSTLAAVHAGCLPLTDCFDAAGAGDPLTFSVKSPNRRIDYLMCGGGARPVGRCRVVRAARASDHFPLRCTVALPADERVDEPNPAGPHPAPVT